MYDKNAPTTIQTMFDSIAPSYDRANQILSFGMHSFWNRSLVRHLKQKKPAKVFLDLCSGTGEIAFAYLKNLQSPPKTYLLDFSASMLAIAKEKAKKLKTTRHLHYIQGDAEKINLKSDSVDHISMAYGIRNIKNPNKCIKEAFRVLKNGGRLGILELTRPKNGLIRMLHSCYLKGFLPIIGKYVTSNKNAYNYLSSSIASFLSPSELEKILKETGFAKIETIPLLGGIATLLIASK
ncbi:MAG: bifunctional demethylmenaquinone methyltransferase/2-methoxy-6-polyprenyl-1,4-benzoquinol methylase UbiE [Chlamydiales bacterium]|nr:bifunctional demethylmenaquinone methyltransferase/2-methoxy-6-polyprenyl-1,4-benzoquinol methylase UbiE [Chlamydiales bacterium]